MSSETTGEQTEHVLRLPLGRLRIDGGGLVTSLTGDGTTGDMQTLGLTQDLALTGFFELFREDGNLLLSGDIVLAIGLDDIDKLLAVVAIATEGSET